MLCGIAPFIDPLLDRPLFLKLSVFYFSVQLYSITFLSWYLSQPSLICIFVDLLLSLLLFTSCVSFILFVIIGLFFLFLYFIILFYNNSFLFLLFHIFILPLLFTFFLLCIFITWVAKFLIQNFAYWHKYKYSYYQQSLCAFSVKTLCVLVTRISRATLVYQIFAHNDSALAEMSCPDALNLTNVGSYQSIILYRD